MEEDQNTNNTAVKRSSLPLLLGGILLLAVAAVGVFALATSGDDTTEPTVSPVAQAPLGTSDVTQETSGEVVEIQMEAGSFYFDPSEIRVKQGDRVRITLSAVDMMHNIAIDEFDVESETVSEGETTTVEFTADIAGEFEYYCGVGNHRERGQVGTLIVE